MEARREILQRVLDLQARVGRQLISDAEVARIRELWAEDALEGARRSAAESDRLAGGS